MMATRDEVAMALRVLCAAYPTHKAKSDTLAVYSVVLSDLPYQELTRAVLWCVSHCRFFPTVAEIREAVGESAPEGERLPGPDEAWGEVVQEIHRIGRWGQPRFSHPVIADTVQRIGWGEICASTEPGVVRGQFLKIYGITEKRMQAQAQALPADHPVMAAMSGLARKMLMGGRDE